MMKSCQQPKVSILIPVYNRENYIGECIQSAISQTYTDIEIVIVDNASTDSTWEICNRFAETDKRIRIFKNETNIGPVRNWLRCLNQSRGEYGKFLFSDDLMFPRFLERTLPYFDSPEIGFVATAAVVGSEPEYGTIMYTNSEKELCLPIERYFERMIRSNVPYSPGAAIFRTADIRDNLLDSFATLIPRDFTINGAGPDIMLYALTALNYKKVVLLPMAEVFFRVHNESITIANSDNDVVKGYRAAIAWFCKKNLNISFWAKYIAITWWAECRINHRFTSLYRHSLVYEGDGKIIEFLLVLGNLLIIVPIDIIKYISKRL